MKTRSKVKPKTCGTYTRLCPRHSLIFENRTQIRCSILGWYDLNKRQFPWRDASDPASRCNLLYRTFVSEAMLQQTQTSTVVPYFNAWMQKWPTIFDLCHATEQEVLALWSGLGYYSRAKRLLSALKGLTSKYKNEEDFETFDPSLSELLKIPGVGHYMASAIQSIVFDLPCAAVDGNFIRVFSRVLGVRQTGEIKLKDIKSLIKETCDDLIDPERPGDFNQAIMDLANTICFPKKTPRCDICPFSQYCCAYNQQNSPIQIEDNGAECLACKSYVTGLNVVDFPGKFLKQARREELFQTLIATTGPNTYILRRRADKGLLADMLELPNWMVDRENLVFNKNVLKSYTNPRSVTKKTRCSFLGKHIHLFSHIRHTYIVFGALMDSESIKLPDDHIVVKEEEFDSYPICTSTIKMVRKYRNLLRTKEP